MGRFPIVVLLSLICFSSCTGGCAVTRALTRMQDHDVDEAQFLLARAVKVESAAIVRPKKDDGGGRPDASTAILVGGTGSGVVVAVRDGRSIVLTANHVCNPQDDKVGEVLHEIVVIAFSGERLHAVQAWNDTRSDLCLLAVAGRLGPVARLAASAPPVGAMLYHAGAPRGLFGDGLGCVDQGHYAGHRQMAGVERTIIVGSTIGGESGAGLYYRRRLVGVIIGIMTEGGYLVVAADLESVRAAMSGLTLN
jgi:Trypsin-like peptidase domain